MKGSAMTAQEILARVDHTLLRADARWADIRKLCKEAVRFRTASVCIPSVFVRRAHEAFPYLPVCTVVGFPLGNANLSAKTAETKQAVSDGASEIDMVISIGALKDGDTAYVTEEIRAVKAAAEGRIVKVIIETCYLTEEEKIAACRCCTEGSADFIKTSTGFGPAGAALSDIALFRAHIGPNVSIKAAGGIRTREDMEAFLAAGASRIGASSAVRVLAEEIEKSKAEQ